MVKSPPTNRVLLISPEPELQRRVQVLLDRHEFLAVAASSAADARRKLRAESFGAVLLDLREPRLADLVAWLAEQRATVVGLVEDAQPEAIERALGDGAVDVIPVGAFEPLLMHRLRLLLAPTAFPSRRAGRPLPRSPRPGMRKQDLLIGQSSGLLAVLRQIDMMAKLDIGVLITGDTGTGKELVARTLHAISPRSKRPLVVANCTALPETLFENELFGHERGAYTGADRRQEGLIHSAEGGALLLDEIGDVALGVQAKLLRLIQFREYKVVGGTRTRRADVRIMATTHRDLVERVKQGQFREDLYYRLNALEIRIPALRHRLDDIPMLVDHFVTLFNDSHGTDFIGFTPAAIRKLSSHAWPGNVRELEHTVNRCLVMAGKRLLDAADVFIEPVGPPPAVDLSRPFAELKREIVERFERAYLEALLARTHGNLSEASRQARHERKSLWRLLKKYDIDPTSFR